MTARTPLIAIAIVLVVILDLLVLSARLPSQTVTARAVDADVTGTGDGSPEAVSAAAAAPPVIVSDAGRIAARSVDLMSRSRLARHGPKPFAPPQAPGDGLAAFEGLSTWIDTYDTSLTAAEQVQIAAAEGVQSVFFQVSRGSTDASIHDYERLSTAIELAHDLDLYVMVWTLPTFERHSLDFARAREAMAFITPRGDRPDAFGLDIESDRNPDVADRSARLLRLMAELREWAGPDYPIASIVLPPLQLELNTVWWPGFPYAEVAALSDVMIPMSYSSYRGTDEVTTFSWNVSNVRRVRQLAGDPDLPVHLAGGIADDLPEVGAFVRAARAGGAIGAGLYDLHTTRPEAWEVLRLLRAEPAGG